MMTIHFANAPLIELIAQFQWDTETKRALAAAERGAPIDVTQLELEERYYERFSAIAEGAGFRSSERLVPPGYPSPVGQAVHRVKSTEEPELLAQVGPGLLVVNAVPPYRAWSDFRPKAQRFMEAALSARHERDKKAWIEGVQLRYINSFDRGWSGELKPADFIEQKLGFKLNLPEGLQVRGNGEYNAVHALSYEYNPDLLVEITVGRGQSDLGEGVLLDLKATRHSPVDPSVDAILTAFDDAHEALHSVFFEISKPLHGTMGPKEVE